MPGMSSRRQGRAQPSDRGAGLGPVGLRRHRSERDRGDIRVLDLPDRPCRRGNAWWHTPASWLGRALTVAGFTIALLAPVIGVWVEAPRRRRLALGTLTGLAVTFTASMSLIREQPGYLWPGLVLLAATAACGDLASVPYNAMLRQLSTTRTSGRISGFGWAAGYVGSVALLLIVYAGFISGSGNRRGLLQLSSHDGWNVRPPCC
ncbi:transporter, MFS superfamily [Mycobacterium xenopi 4042]|uniref:Transporter, MFS superfamily n=1 Tax=Mycobacterium xenopi 4042 TaxID=1299334 RepID=X8APN1_MYCXE|nr:transporter, MFS superfamily [Mycobacterium xenopi 4042]